MPERETAYTDGGFTVTLRDGITTDGLFDWEYDVSYGGVTIQHVPPHELMNMCRAAMEAACAR